MRVLIVGCGNIAGGFDAARPAGAPPFTHAGAFAENTAFSIAACVDPDDCKREAFRARWAVGEAFGSMRALAGRQGYFDVVSICSPTSYHSDDLAAAVALKPRLIFCEKPIAPSLEAATDAVERCRAAGILMAVNHTRRWAPDVERLRHQLARGDWGAIRSVACTYNKGILNNGAHMVDLLHLLVGPVRLRWAGAPIDDHAAEDPTIAAALETEGGVPISLNMACAADYAQFELQIVAERGTITMEDGGAAWRLRRAIDSPYFKGYKALDRGEYIEGEYKLAMRAAAVNLLEALQGRAMLASTGDTALAAHAVCAEIRRAADDISPSPMPSTQRHPSKHTRTRAR